MIQAVSIWAVTRIAFALFTYFAATFNAQPTSGKFAVTAFPPSRLLDMWNRWDTQWYIRIAETGYDAIQTAAFFPLYPLLIHIGAGLAGFDHIEGVALAVSNLATLAAFVGLGLLATQEYGPGTARYAILAAAAYPLAFFTAGGYSDSVFLAFATWCLLFARRGQWLPAAACASLATFTRLFGIVLILSLIWEFVRQHDNGRAMLRRPRALVEGIAIAGAVPVTLVAWAAYLRFRFHDPVAYLTVQKKDWDHYSVSPWRAVQIAIDSVHHVPSWTYLQSRIFFDLGPVFIFLLLALLMIRRMPVSFVLYTFGMLLICFTSSVPGNFDPVTGQGRYMIMAIPIYLVLGTWIRRWAWLDAFWLSGGFLLQGLFTAFFLRGGWLV